MAGTKSTGGVRSFKPSTAAEEFEVPLEDAPDDDADDIGSDDDDPEPLAARDRRQEKRNRRYDGILTKAQEEARAAREEAATLKTRLDAIEQRGRDTGPNQREKLDKAYEDHLNELYAQEDEIAQTFETLKANKMLTPEKGKELATKARAVERKKLAAAAYYDRVTSGPAPQQNTLRQMLVLEYPEMADDKAWEYAGTIARQRALRGEKDGGIKMYREIAEQSREELRLGKPKPDAGQRDLYTSRGAGRGGNTRSTVTVTMGKAQKDMAHSSYPHLPPAKAERLWAETAGKRAALKSKQRA